MAKKTANSVQKNITTELVTPKEVFKKDLDARISIGEELYSRKIETQADFKKLKEDYNAWGDYNLEYLKHAFNNEHNEYRSSYDNVGAFSYTTLNSRQKTPAQELTVLKDGINNKIQNLVKLKSKTDLLKISDSALTEVAKTDLKLDTSKVFIVHGHDEEAKTKAARFVEKLGFEAIILHEQASSSKTIIEKIEDYSDVGFGIVLYTPCDVGSKNIVDPKLKNRARQNVVFEHGFLIGKIGRSKVCALVKGDTEIPNDISGVVYIPMDDSDSWRYSVAKEMKEAGYDVDMNLI